MGETTQQNRKIYYSMGEVAEMFDVNPSLIRFWEKKFHILRPDKNKKGNRLFTPKDIENLKLIYHLVKEKGMTLAGAQKRLKENREGLERSLEVIDKLQRVKTMLLEIRQELKSAGEGSVEVFIDHSIDSAAQPPRSPTKRELTPQGISIESPPKLDELSADAVVESSEQVPASDSNAHELTPQSPQETPRMQVVEQTLF